MARTKLCPHCANPIKRSHKFCRFCGAKRRKRVSTPLLIGSLGAALLVVVVVWFLTYLIPTDSSKENLPEPLAREVQESAERQTSPLESAQAPGETIVDPVRTARSPIGIAEATPSIKEPSRRIEKEKDSPLRREEKMQPEVAIVKKESIPSSTPDLPIPSSPPGEYKTMRSTVVFGEPRTDSERITMLDPGTRVMVVGSKGDWLEVRSRHGRPPGFIRRDNAMFIKNAD